MDKVTLQQPIPCGSDICRRMLQLLVCVVVLHGAMAWSRSVSQHAGTKTSETVAQAGISTEVDWDILLGGDRAE